MTACGPVYGHDLYRLKTIPIRFPGCGYYLRWYYNGWHYWFFLPGQSTFQTEGENYRTLGTRTIIIGSGQITLGECAAIRTIMNTREVEIYTDSGWANVRIEPGSAIVKNNFINGYEIELTATLGSRAISKATGYTPIQNIPLIPPVPDPTICQTIIGTQIWMCKNYDINFPGSKVYNNDEINRPLYGGLYTKVQVNTPGFCPTGWHVPTYDDWQTLFTYIGGLINGGYKLKSLGNTYWLPSGTGNDTYGFDARGAGLYSTAFVLLQQYAKFWIGGHIPIGDPNTVELADASDDIQLVAPPITYFQSVRLICDLPAPSYPSFNDWFLPSLDEWNLIYLNIPSRYVAGLYWTSSEGSATDGMKVNTATGLFSSEDKSISLKVIACRSFAGSVGEYTINGLGPAGGLIFGYYGGLYYEASPQDCVNSIWSNRNTVAVGTTVDDIGKGQLNTLAIIGQIGHLDSAAKLCDDYVS
jgi:uncharacterized protein (TIGR02145 family)